MSLLEWYAKREILLTGVTSELGGNLFEKLLRSFPDVKVHVVLRSRDGMNQTDRVKKRLYDSPGYERLRQERPNAMDRVEVYEGNLVYDDLGLIRRDTEAMRNVSLVFHTAGPSAKLVEYCRQLPNLQALVLAVDVFSYKQDQVNEIPISEDKLPRELPLCLVRLPAVGPAYREPMPGFAQSLSGATALMIGAGHMHGRPDLPAEIVPVDIASNTLVAAPWNYDKINKSTGIYVCNASSLNCSWAELIQKGGRANQKFRYPTFRVRGITSSTLLHWMIVFLFEWLPSLFCDTIFFAFRKERITEEHHRVRKLLKSFEPMTFRTLTVQRRKIFEILRVLSAEDQEAFPLRADIDVEAYILCAAAAARKYSVNDSNLTIVTLFAPALVAVSLLCLAYSYYFCL